MARRLVSRRGAVVVLLVVLATCVSAATFAGANPSPTAFVSITKASRVLQRLAGTKLARHITDEGMVLTPLDAAHPGRLGWFSVLVWPSESSAPLARRATWLHNQCGLTADGYPCWLASWHVATNVDFVVNALGRTRTVSRQALVGRLMIESALSSSRS